MSSLISLVVVDQEPRVDSRLIAEQLGVEHESFRKLVYQYQPDFEEFGILRFEIGEIKGRGQPQKYVLLNEDQSYLGLTYTQNTPQARDLKKRLVHSFAEHRRMLAAPTASSNPVLAAQLAELLQGKVLVDVDTLSQLTRIVFALEGFLPHIVPLAKDLEKQCGQPLIADLASYRPASTPPPRAGRPSSLAAQRRFDPADPWIPAVQAYVADRQEVTLTEVLLHLAIEPNQRTKNRLSKLLQGLGWRLHVTSVQGNGCRVYRND